MSDDLQRQLAEFLKFLLAQVQDATAFAKMQIPPLVAEKIRFGRVWHLVGLLLCGVVAWRAVGMVKWCYDKSEDDEFWAVPGVALVVVMVIACGMAFDELRSAMLAWLAPRLYVIEWLVDLTKGHT